MLVTFATGYGQPFDDFVDFERDASDWNYFTFDKNTHTGNIWQIGVPGKSVFDSAYSPVHAIVTDTMHPYPANDTSTFIITHIRPLNAGGNESLQLNFHFKMQTDSLTEFGKVEASTDQGVNWINLMTQDSALQFTWLEPKPVLTGSSNGWQYFSLELRSLTYIFGYSDTLLYRFTFISDSIETGKAGWMLDDFQFIDGWEGIDDNYSDHVVSIVPNPTTGIIKLNFTSERKHNHIQVLNTSGQVVYKTSDYREDYLNLSHLQPGVYFIRYSSENQSYTGKFILVK